MTGKVVKYEIKKPIFSGLKISMFQYIIATLGKVLNFALAML